MAVDLGDIYPLSVSIFDANGVLANATTVTLSVTKPDGSTFLSGTVVPTSTGVYNYDYTPDQVGRHNVAWSATGTNASAYTDSFYVQPTDGGDFISLAQFKAHVKVVGTTSDESLRTFISAACRMISDRMGTVSPTTVVVDVFPSSYGTISLDNYPVISVTSIQMLPGLVTVPQGNPATGAVGWILDSAAQGRICFWGYGLSYSYFRITYRAGRSVIPQNYILAALELTGHLWRTSQLNPSGGRPVVSVDPTVVPGVTYAFPYSVRQLLGLDKRPQARVFI